MSTALGRGGRSQPLASWRGAHRCLRRVHLVLWAEEDHDIKITGVLFLLNVVAVVVIAVPLITKPLGASRLGKRNDGMD